MLLLAVVFWGTVLGVLLLGRPLAVAASIAGVASTLAIVSMAWGIAVGGAPAERRAREVGRRSRRGAEAAEQRMTEEVDRLRAVIAVLGEGVALVDSHGTVLLHNAALGPGLRKRAEARSPSTALACSAAPAKVVTMASGVIRRMV